MKTETPCPICGAVVEHDLPPGEDFECPNCKATVIVPDPKEREEWPEPFVGPPAFSPAVRAALLRALRAERDEGAVPDGAEAFVESCFSEQRLLDIHKRAKAGHDLSELDDLYREHYAPIYAAAVDAVERRVKRRRRIHRLIWAAVIVFALVRGCSCLVRSAEEDERRRAAARAAKPAPAKPTATTMTRRQAPPPSTATSTTQTRRVDRWRVTVSRDPMDDRIVTMMIGTGEPVRVGGLYCVPALMLRRVGGKPESFAFSGDPMSFSSLGEDVTIRFDSANAETSRWNGSENGAGLFYPGDKAEFFTRALLASRLRIRTQTILGHSVTAEFDLAGMRAAWDAFSHDKPYDKQ